MEKNKVKYIAVDFDGTVVEDKFPEVGKTLPYAVEILKALTENGHKIILFTVRGDKYLKDAVKWYKKHFRFLM